MGLARGAGRRQRGDRPVGMAPPQEALGRVAAGRAQAGAPRTPAAAAERCSRRARAWTACASPSPTLRPALLHFLGSVRRSAASHRPWPLPLQEAGRAPCRARRSCVTSQLTTGPAGWWALPFRYAGADACALRQDGSGRWVGFTRRCPHAGIDLLGGEVEDLGQGDIVIACPAHTYLFNADTGACLWDACRNRPPPTPPVATFDVHQSFGGGVWVRPREAPAACTVENWDQARADALQLEMVDRALARKFPDN